MNYTFSLTSSFSKLCQLSLSTCYWQFAKPCYSRAIWPCCGLHEGLGGDLLSALLEALWANWSPSAASALCLESCRPAGPAPSSRKGQGLTTGWNRRLTWAREGKWGFMQNSHAEIGGFFPLALHSLIFCEDGGEREEARGLAWLTEVINSQARIRVGLHLHYLVWNSSDMKYENWHHLLLHEKSNIFPHSLHLADYFQNWSSWASCTPAALLALSSGSTSMEVSCSMQSSGRSHKQTCTPQPYSSHAEWPCLKPSVSVPCSRASVCCGAAWLRQREVQLQQVPRGIPAASWGLC